MLPLATKVNDEEAGLLNGPGLSVLDTWQMLAKSVVLDACQIWRKKVGLSSQDLLIAGINGWLHWGIGRRGGGHRRKGRDFQGGPEIKSVLSNSTARNNTCCEGSQTVTSVSQPTPACDKGLHEVGSRGWTVTSLDTMGLRSHAGLQVAETVDGFSQRGRYIWDVGRRG